MTSNLALVLNANSNITGSYNNRISFIFNTGPACNSDANCIMNGDTTMSGNNYYYNWFAATAGRGTTSSLGDIDGSICPIGWKIPSNYSINQKQSFGSVTNSYGFTTNGEMSSDNFVSSMETFPLSFVRSGFYHSGEIRQTDGGYYWASTAHLSIDSYAIYLLYRATGLYPGAGDGGKYLGMSIRCIAN